LTHEAPLKLYAWQEADVKRCVQSITPEVGALITSAPGAGKTVVAVEIAKRLKAKVILIVGPQSTLEGSWRRTARRQGLADDVRLLIGTTQGKKNFEALRWREPGIYVTTPQYFARRKDWGTIKPDMIIFDEIHQVTAHGNVSQKALMKLWAPIRVGLSGTPLRNRFENAWALVRWIEPAKMPLTFWVWRLRHCETEYDRFAPQQRKVVGELRPGELFKSLTCFIQHLQRERCCDYHPNGFLAGLPEPLYIERIIPMSRAQAKFYEEIERALVSELSAPDKKTGKAKVIVELPVEARGMLRLGALALPYAVMEKVTDEWGMEFEKARLHFADDTESPKLDAFIEDLPSYEGTHTLALTHSKRFAKFAVARLTEAGYAVEGWHGDITPNNRRTVRENFASGKTEIIVGVISAMGTGTDGLQEVCNNLSWLSRDDDTSNNTQGIGRLDRLGQSKQVVTRDYISQGTIDQGMYSKDITLLLKLNESLRGADHG
jgi:hypothetical protein